MTGKPLGCAVAGALAILARIASAQVPSEASGSAATATEVRNTSASIPNVAFAYSANGAVTHTMGIQGYGLGLVATGQSNTVGGGGSVWGSPVDRLTLVLDAQRNVSRNFSPSAAAIYRFVGNGIEGFSFAGLGKFKVDGFSAGPSGDEIESELELGALVTVLESRWIADLNAIAGRGLGDDGETDAEGRLRLAHTVGSMLRLGIDGQARMRLAGPRELPNGRTWDFALGPQALLFTDQFYGSITAGPTTMGLTSSNVGWVAIASLGGTTF